MSYILLLVFSTLGLYNGPKFFTLSEFQTKQACEIALKEANNFYKTVRDESKCISVEHEIKKVMIEEQVKKLKEGE